MVKQNIVSYFYFLIRTKINQQYLSTLILLYFILHYFEFPHMNNFNEQVSEIYEIENDWPAGVGNPFHISDNIRIHFSLHWSRDPHGKCPVPPLVMTSQEPNFSK